MITVPSKTFGLDAYKGDNCKLLIHSNTTDGSTTFADSSGQGHTVTQGAATCEHDTAQKKFGASSILFDGVDGFVNVADHADLDLGSGLFSIDFWMRMNALPGDNNQFDILSRQVDVNNYMMLHFYDLPADSSGFRFQWYVSSAYEVNASFALLTTPSVDTWYHVYACRGWGGNANDYMVTLDGQPFDSVVTDSSTLTDLAADLKIGDANTSLNFDGWIDELHWVKGDAMHKQAFVPLKLAYR